MTTDKELEDEINKISSSCITNFNTNIRLKELQAELKGRTDTRKETLEEMKMIFLSSDIDSKMYLYCDFITEELNKNNEHRDWKMFAVDLILKDIINELGKLGEK
jgi:hypothetical protein